MSQISCPVILGRFAAAVSRLLFVLVCAGAATCAVQAAEIVAEHDFEAPFVAFSESPGVTGVLPEGWTDASAADSIVLRYSELREAPFAGEQSLLMELSSVTGGSAFLVTPPVDLSRGELLRIRLALRSPTNASVYIRLTSLSDPEETYWQQRLGAVPEWGVSTLLLAVPEGVPEARLSLAMTVPGRIETDAWIIEALDLDDLIGERDFTANLLPASSFPLGPTSPTVAGGNFRPDWAVVADTEMKGPTGNPALRLTGFLSEGFTTVRFSAPFEARPGRVHTFSFWARGSAGVPTQSVSVQMGHPGQMVQRSITLTPDWVRYEISTELTFSASRVYLVRLVSGSPDPFWVDGLRVAEGDALGDYESSGPVELTMEPSAGSGLFFAGEPFVVNLGLWGALNAVERLEGTLRHADGRAYALPEFPISPGGEALLLPTLELPHVGEPDLGTFVLALRAVDAFGAPLSKWAETLVHRIRPARHAHERAPDSAFGTHIFWTEREAQRAKALGFNWVRGNYQLPWSGLEPTPGDWRWDTLDSRIAHPREANLEIFAYLSSAPGWASTAGEAGWGPGTGWWRFTAPPRGEPEILEAFGNYAFRVLERYGSDLAALETWNEPFLAGFFAEDVVNGTPMRAPPERLHAMTQQVRAAADAAGYDGPLFWNVGAHYGASERAFDEANLDMGTADYVDAYSIHRYTTQLIASPGDQLETDMALIRDLFPGVTTMKPVWNSEGGVGPAEVFSLYEHQPARQTAQRTFLQANHFVRYHLSNFAAGVEKIFSYAFFEQDNWRADYSYMHADGRLSHIATVFSNLAWHLEGKNFAASQTREYGIRTFEFHPREAEDLPVAVVLISPQRSILTRRPATATLLDIHGNPVETPSIIDSAILYLTAEDLDAALAEIEDAIVWSPRPSPFRFFTDLGDSWRQTFLGRVNDRSWPFLEHATMGRLYAWSEATGQSLHVYDYSLRSWLFLPSPGFPWIYHHPSGAWMWYAQNTAVPKRWFWVINADSPDGGAWRPEATVIP